MVDSMRIVEQPDIITEIMTEKTFLDNLANGDAAEPVDAAELGDVDSKITESNDGQTMRSRNGHRSHNKSRATFPTQTLLSKSATRVHQVEAAVKPVLFVTR